MNRRGFLNSVSAFVIAAVAHIPIRRRFYAVAMCDCCSTLCRRDQMYPIEDEGGGEDLLLCCECAG